MGLKNYRENKEVGDNDGANEEEGGERDSVSAWEGLIGRGYGGWGVAYPAFSVDVAGLCGPPYTDTPANESDLVSISQKNSISTSLCSPEQSTPPLIF